MDGLRLVRDDVADERYHGAGAGVRERAGGMETDHLMQIGRGAKPAARQVSLDWALGRLPSLVPDCEGTGGAIVAGLLRFEDSRFRPDISRPRSAPRSGLA